MRNSLDDAAPGDLPMLQWPFLFRTALNLGSAVGHTEAGPAWFGCKGLFRHGVMSHGPDLNIILHSLYRSHDRGPKSKTVEDMGCIV